MNKDIIKGNWLQLKGKVRQQWGNITDDDVAKMKGSYEELQGVLQERYGYAKDRAEEEISNFLSVYDIKEFEDDQLK